MSVSEDPSKGGSLSDMAPEGTSIPADSGTQRVIPSVPNPFQAAESDDVVDNPADIPRGPGDSHATGEVVTASGEPMPPTVETKRGHLGGGNPEAKGSLRYDKHTKDKESHLEAGAQASHEVEPAPGEEEDDQDTIRDRKGA